MLSNFKLCIIDFLNFFFVKSGGNKTLGMPNKKNVQAKCTQVSFALLPIKKSKCQWMSKDTILKREQKNLIKKGEKKDHFFFDR